VGLAALALLVAASLLAPAGSGADPTALRQRADALRRESTSLQARTHRALLDLYALDAQLTRARSRDAALRAQVASVRAEQVLVGRQVHITRRALAVSQHRLARHVRALYEQGGVDPLAVLLGSTSLDQALTNIDALNHAAEQGESIVEQTRATRAELAHLAAKLAARRARLESLVREAAHAAAELEATRSDRAGYLASLRTRQHLNARAIASLDAAARAAEAKSEQLAAAASSVRPAALPAETPAAITAAPAAAPVEGEPAPADAGQTLTVVTTGYSIHGRTATGVTTGWGVAAVDPSVIPLGTRFSVPGYGTAVAADTGGAVQGATVDLWFPTLAQARAWGRRTVTITFG
jgi:3D (Asp-Asp-Asp) domain-containing protein